MEADRAGCPLTGAPGHSAGADAVAELLTLQAEYTSRLETLPDSSTDRIRQRRPGHVELDLDALASAEPPRGYGRTDHPVAVLAPVKHKPAKPVAAVRPCLTALRATPVRCSGRTENGPPSQQENENA